MAVNPYDQASRYLMRLDPAGLLRWLFAVAVGQLRFLGWLETRSIPFPGTSVYSSKRGATGDHRSGLLP